MKIALGVLDVPYNRPESYRAVGRRRAPRRIRRRATITTGQLAEILEEDYGINAFFLEAHGEEVIGGILEGHALNLARPKTGTGSRTDHLKRALRHGEEVFRTMLNDREMDGHRPNVPTKIADIQGRASFVDTGLFRDSFRIEVEDE